MGVRFSMDPLTLSPILFAGILAVTAFFSAALIIGDRRAVRVEIERRRRNNAA